mmetsp:Transcript_36073/g.114678  ORF Transcript_36073/g.114678 Transcript_36073/m.114678 type:complete len:245 (-) Transcript_36073:60-794(-)
MPARAPISAPEPPFAMKPGSWHSWKAFLMSSSLRVSTMSTSSPVSSEVTLRLSSMKLRNSSASPQLPTWTKVIERSSARFTLEAASCTAAASSSASSGFFDRRTRIACSFWLPSSPYSRSMAWPSAWASAGARHRPPSGSTLSQMRIRLLTSLTPAKSCTSSPTTKTSRPSLSTLVTCCAMPFTASRALSQRGAGASLAGGSGSSTGMNLASSPAASSPATCPTNVLNMPNMAAEAVHERAPRR